MTAGEIAALGLALGAAAWLVRRARRGNGDEHAAGCGDCKTSSPREPSSGGPRSAAPPTPRPIPPTMPPTSPAPHPLERAAPPIDPSGPTGGA